MKEFVTNISKTDYRRWIFSVVYCFFYVLSIGWLGLAFFGLLIVYLIISGWKSVFTIIFIVLLLFFWIAIVFGTISGVKGIVKFFSLKHNLPKMRLSIDADKTLFSWYDGKKHYTFHGEEVSCWNSYSTFPAARYNQQSFEKRHAFLMKDVFTLNTGETIVFYWLFNPDIHSYLSENAANLHLPEPIVVEVESFLYLKSSKSVLSTSYPSVGILT